MRLIAITLLAAALLSCAPQQQSNSTQPAAIADSARSLAPDKLFEDVRILSADDMEGRLAGSPGGARARAYITRRFAEIGIAPALSDGLELAFPIQRGGSSLQGVNLIGLIKGTSSSDRALFLMAHYDHVGVRAGQTYNGADDNASGVAALLAIATSFKASPPLHDIVIAAVDAEEGGIRGSRTMVADLKVAGLIARTALAVNFDMLSRSDRNELYASGGFRSPWLKPRLAAIAAQAPVALKVGHDDPALGKDDWTSQSDHVAFHQIGKPWVYFGVEDHADYHQPTDDFDAIPQDFFRNAAATVELAVRAFDRDLDAIAREGQP